jgi:hypothetical protein
MATTPGPPNRLQPPRVLPALPLISPRRPSAEKDRKENKAPSRKEPGLQQRYQPEELCKVEPVEKLTETVSRLDLGSHNGNAPASAASPSASPGRPSLAFVPCPPLPISAPLSPEKAIHSGFMREALDMVCISLFLLLLVYSYRGSSKRPRKGLRVILLCSPLLQLHALDASGTIVSRPSVHDRYISCFLHAHIVWTNQRVHRHDWHW